MKGYFMILGCFISTVSQASLPDGFTAALENSDLTSYFSTKGTAPYQGDFGYMLLSQPNGVFMPENVEQLQDFLPLAKKYKVPLTCRGKGHCLYGQSQAQAGVILDLSRLNIDFHYAAEDNSSLVVPSFKTWADLHEFTNKQNMTVPVVIDYLDLTIGGSLSFGVIGGSSYTLGSASDHVTSLDVITLDGKRHICSTEQNRELFEAVLCGLGQYAIMVSATLQLVPAKSQVNVYKLSYDSVDSFLHDQMQLYHSKVFDHLKGSLKQKEGKWVYVIEAATYFDEVENTNIESQLEALTFKKKSCDNMPYLNFISMVRDYVKLLKEAGKLDLPHPWYCVFMPESNVQEHIEDALDTTLLTGMEPFVVYPMDASCFKRPLFMAPTQANNSAFFYVGVKYNTSFVATPDYPYQEALKRNQELLEKALAVGGCRYPMDAVQVSEDYWRVHYRERWLEVCALKEKYDPDHLLSAGFKMFK
jgi:cytokinin dehydrogenase